MFSYLFCNLRIIVTLELKCVGLLEAMIFKHHLFKTQIQIVENEEVWAKHKNGRYYKARVLKIIKSKLYSVYFPSDNSFSDDVRPEDVRGLEDGKKPQLQQKLQVRWTDGEVYDAQYLSSMSHVTYTVSAR